MIYPASSRGGAPAAAYVHIPFCPSKCHYCGFSSYPGLGPLFDRYVAALSLEIRRTTEARPRDLHSLRTLYFGGGTPTLLSAKLLAGLVEVVRDSLGLDDDAEVTVEANPGTVDVPKLAQLLGAGFNRLSLGIQSLDASLLARLGRAHTAQQALDAYRAARDAGFGNVGIDLMFALPGQSRETWATTLDAAVELSPEHISLYELSIEEGTRFATLCAEGKLQPADEDLQLAMYEDAIDHLTRAGYEHYEVSNFARPGLRSRHNQVYWRNEPCYGFGAGATSYVDGRRERRVEIPSDYIDAIESGGGAIEYAEELTGPALAGETIVLGLRMLEGVDLSRVSERTGVDAVREFAPQIESLAQRGLLIVDEPYIRVTHQGLLLLNDVAREFVRV